MELQRRGRAVEAKFQTREAAWPNEGLHGQGFAVVERTMVATIAWTARGGGTNYFTKLLIRLGVILLIDNRLIEA